MKNTRRDFLLTAISAPVAAAVAVTAPGAVPSRGSALTRADIIAVLKECYVGLPYEQMNHQVLILAMFDHSFEGFGDAPQRSWRYYPTLSV